MFFTLYPPRRVYDLKRPAFVGCTDLTLNAARFSLEITIRDLKQHVGSGDYQSTTAIDRFVQLYCTALCIGKVMMLPENAPTWLDDGKPTAINALSFARARRGLRRFVEFPIDPRFEKSRG